jgi:hypothetical protein
MNKQDFLDRCSTAYDAWYINSDSLLVLELALELTMRWISRDLHQNQIASEIDEKLMKIAKGRELANFRELYEALQFWTLLNHSCQKCATNKEKWHTRWCNWHNDNFNTNF